MIRIVEVCSDMEERILELAQLEEECFSEPWSLEAIRESIAMTEEKNPGYYYRFLAADCDGKTVGYVCACNTLGEINIANVSVTEDHRSQGIATMLMEELERRAVEKGASAIFLEVRVSNNRALGLYRKRGFEIQSILPDFYRKPKENGFLMKKTL